MSNYFSNFNNTRSQSQSGHVAAAADPHGTMPSPHCSGLGATSPAPGGWAHPVQVHFPQDPMQGSQNNPHVLQQDRLQPRGTVSVIVTL